MKKSHTREVSNKQVKTSSGMAFLFLVFRNHIIHKCEKTSLTCDMVLHSQSDIPGTPAPEAPPA